MTPGLHGTPWDSQVWRKWFKSSSFRELLKLKADDFCFLVLKCFEQLEQKEVWMGLDGFGMVWMGLGIDIKVLSKELRS